MLLCRFFIAISEQYWLLLVLLVLLILKEVTSSMEYRQAKINDVPLFTENRWEFVNTIGKLDNEADFKARTEQYLREHLSQGDILVFVAVEGGQIISSCMACIFELPPLLICPSGKRAEILSVYTKADYRRQGHAENLLRLLLAELKKKGVGKVSLCYTDAGKPLYQKLGFVDLPHQMELEL